MIIIINSSLIPNNRIALQLTANFLHILRYMTFLGLFNRRTHAQLQKTRAVAPYVTKVIQMASEKTATSLVIDIDLLID